MISDNKHDSCACEYKNNPHLLQKKKPACYVLKSLADCAIKC